MTETTKLPESICLDCGKKLDAATSSTDDSSPSAGDVTICFYCGHVMVFAADLTLRAPTDTEMYEIAGDKQLLQAQRLLARFKEDEKHHG